MVQHRIVSQQEWIEARKEHMTHEKELMRARDRLNEERRALPWVKVDKTYVFDGRAGKLALADLFKDKPQLVVQHVMFRPDWDVACKSCSFWADGLDRMAPHLAARDTTMVAVSPAPVEKLEASRPAAMTSIPITASASRANRSTRANTNTILAPRRSTATNCPASACSIATRMETSSIPTHAMRAAST
jgi:predicted dithiol-disulfide oxidoreductase (DUF899 family)